MKRKIIILTNKGKRGRFHNSLLQIFFLLFKIFTVPPLCHKKTD